MSAVMQDQAMQTQAAGKASLLQASGLVVKADERRLLDGVHLELQPGQLLGVLGPNGAGKTTLLRALLGVVQPEQGAITLEDKPLQHWSARERARRMAYLAQGQQVHWPLPVRDVVALGRLPHGDGHTASGRQAVEQAMELADCHTLAARNVQTLSGGERARVLLARALATQAPVLLADEPLAALDPAHQLHIMALLQQLAGQGMAVAVVLHDLTLASRFCTQVCVLQQGRMVARGAPHAVLDDDLLQQVFNLQVLRMEQPGASCVVPWEVFA